MKSFSQLPLLPVLFLQRKCPFPVSSDVNCPDYAATVTASLVFCPSAYGHSLQDLTRLLLECPASEPLRRAFFGTTSFTFDP